MRQTSSTYGNFPLITGKPGEFSAKRTPVGTARRRLKTADLKNQPMGIGKRVQVTPLNGKPVPLMGDKLTTGLAQNGTAILDRFFANLFIRIRPITRSFPSGVIFETMDRWVCLHRIYGSSLITNALKLIL